MSTPETPAPNAQQMREQVGLEQQQQAQRQQELESELGVYRHAEQVSAHAAKLSQAADEMESLPFGPGLDPEHEKAFGELYPNLAGTFGGKYILNASGIEQTTQFRGQADEAKQAADVAQRAAELMAELSAMRRYLESTGR